MLAIHYPALTQAKIHEKLLQSHCTVSEWRIRSIQPRDLYFEELVDEMTHKYIKKPLDIGGWH
jgi:hypothetical protein